jgi:prepilin-type N-terminal cleavage/methylation domain-containing protein
MKFQRGFTLIELMVVILIIAILAVLTLGAGGYLQERAARSRAQAEIAALEATIEVYKIESGAFPGVGASDFDPPNPKQLLEKTDPEYLKYINTGKILFRALAGREKWNEPATEKVYFEFKRNQTFEDKSDGRTYVADPFRIDDKKCAYGYSVKTTLEDPNGLASYNTGFPDIWSTVGTYRGYKKRADDMNIKNWVTNWGTP